MEVPILPSLGTLSKLPTEIRLLIWDYLLDTIHTQLPNHTTYSANPLSILCASGYLYNEISSHLYHECTQHIVLDPEYDKHEWMKVRLQSRTVNVDLIFKNNEEAKTHFQTFPHHRTNMVVYLAPPSSMDPGQVVLMWQKTTALVDLLIPTTSTQQVRVCTVGSWESIDPPTHWQGRRSDFFEMGGLQETISSPYTYHPDQDIALLPFLRLGLWFKNPHIDVPALSDDEFNILHHHLSSLFNQKGFNHRFNTLHCLRKETAVFQIERTIIETDVFLDNSLDELPGITAAFLRLERFKHWFKDGQSCISPYEEKVAEKLSVCPCAVLKMDPWLARMGLRYSVLMLFYFTLTADNIKRVHESDMEFAALVGNVLGWPSERQRTT
ncbi:hypothetical protein N7457_007942 [Penicillium paradoxum]|uniref:uncharacterized protein n=1 Tax=Penicillium paradoxum TaxID=176176 RepID=UPI002547C698|nr:uncharacterized protein N7457_007942 [Penicillium paradoxum]KAJ5773046.1 hypothetical protein N7457_007942 [Penicillium paradoxum]